MISAPTAPDLEALMAHHSRRRVIEELQVVLEHLRSPHPVDRDFVSRHLEAATYLVRP